MAKQLLILNFIFLALQCNLSNAEEECTLIDDLKRLKIQVRLQLYSSVLKGV